MSGTRKKIPKLPAPTLLPGGGDFDAVHRIPKPVGEAGRTGTEKRVGYNVLEASRLTKKEYRRLRYTVFQGVYSYLNLRVPYRNQNTNDVQSFIQFCCGVHPWISLYEGHWLAAVIAKSFLRQAKKKYNYRDWGNDEFYRRILTAPSTSKSSVGKPRGKAGARMKRGDIEDSDDTDLGLDVDEGNDEDEEDEDGRADDDKDEGDEDEENDEENDEDEENDKGKETDEENDKDGKADEENNEEDKGNDKDKETDEENNKDGKADENKEEEGNKGNDQNNGDNEAENQQPLPSRASHPLSPTPQPPASNFSSSLSPLSSDEEPPKEIKKRKRLMPVIPKMSHAKRNAREALLDAPDVHKQATTSIKRRRR